MAMNWKYFTGATILAWGLLLKAGAPFGALALGTVAAAVWHYYRSRPTTR
jgi:hypothetical protein